MKKMKKKTEEKDVFKLPREQLVFHMQSSRVLKSEALKKAFLNVKREFFMPKEFRQFAYADNAFPIGFGQTISQPSTIAVMLELLDVKKGNKVFEVGAGSGYVAALLSELTGKKGKVYAVEIVKELIPLAKENLAKAGYKNVEVTQGDGSLGLKKKAPFDRILISCACPYFPEPLVEQLKENGVIVAPLGDRFSQQMVKARKIKGKLVKETYYESMFVFVPLQGKYGFGGKLGGKGIEGMGIV